MTVLHPVAENNEWRSVARRDEEFPECSTLDFEDGLERFSSLPALWVRGR